MNSSNQLPPIKTGSKPITVPEVPRQPKATSHAARMEAALVGKFFMFVFKGGTRFRSGRIVGVLSDQFIKVCYFSVSVQLTGGIVLCKQFPMRKERF
jgi:hypothetical protein